MPSTLKKVGCCKQEDDIALLRDCVKDMDLSVVLDQFKNVVIVYLLDKTVWLLLITVITTQALQIVGVVETPKSARELSVPDTINNFDFTEETIFRTKRDTSDTTDRSQFIDTLFNRNRQWRWKKKLEHAFFTYKIINKIPIKTLTAVNNLIQNSRPALRKLREFAARRFEKTTKAPDVDSNTIQKRSYPVFIRPVGEKN